jgi:peptidoglycan/LPS O-acetylase OafA/YrhL
MLTNRLRRVTLVGAAFWLVLQPLLLAAASWAHGRVAGETNDAGLPAHWSIDRPMHLWFLWYLTWYCVLAWATLRAAEHRDAVRLCVSHAFGRLMRNTFAPVIAALVMVPLFVRQGGPVLTPSSFAPHPWVFLTYGAFFSFGWLLWSQRGTIASLHAGAVLRTTLSMVCIVTAVVMASTMAAGSPRQVVVLAIGSSLSAWLAVFGFLGLASRYASRRRAVVLYLADASYWIYLIHLPVIVALGGLIAPAPLRPFMKATLVILATSAVTVATYALFVRRTFIGRFMTGR